MIYKNIQLQQLLQVLGTLYPTVSLVPYLKICTADGNIIRRGHDDKASWPFSVVAMKDTLERQKQKAFERYAPETRQVLGRDPKPDEIRIAFRPAQGHFRSVFVDDVSGLTRAHLLIETSPGSWHGHFILNREVTIDIAAAIQRYMIANTVGAIRPTADPGAASPRQARRFPEGKFIHDTLLPPLDVDILMAKIKASQPERPQSVPIVPQSREEHWDEVALEEVYIRHIAKVFDNPKSKDKSYSAVDVSFAMYLMGHCRLSEEFTREALHTVGHNIESRHPQIEYYIDMTIGKALKYLDS